MTRGLPLASAAVALAALSLVGAAPPQAAPNKAKTESRAETTDRGTFTLLTYNVAGLPFLISESDPVDNIPVIGGLLNLYDVAFVQEDFAYHDQLAAGAKHPFRTPPVVMNDKVGIGDGLNVFSRIRFRDFERVAWRACNGHFSDGADCFAPKGFAAATGELGPGVEVDLYDLHMDSGDSPADVSARAVQAEQLAAYLAHRSKDRAVIVAGDTNMGRESEPILEKFLKEAELGDACRSLGCNHASMIDRVMFRSSSTLTLRALDFVVDRRFVRPDGRDLSDHKAVGVVFEWAHPHE